ncbi:MAG: hypothetical protein ABIV47_12475, partial [Roseiflexaceae bacterium]
GRILLPLLQARGNHSPAAGSGAGDVGCDRDYNYPMVEVCVLPPIRAYGKIEAGMFAENMALPRSCRYG